MKITFRTLAHPRADLERLKRGPQKSQNCLPKSLRGGQSQKKFFFCNLKICSNVRKKVSISKYLGYRIPRNASPSLKTEKGICFGFISHIYKCSKYLQTCIRTFTYNMNWGKFVQTLFS